jgi:hypothetical protein
VKYLRLSLGVAVLILTVLLWREISLSRAQVSTLAAQSDALAAELIRAESALLVAESGGGDAVSAYYAGAFSTCRTFAEGLFGVPASEAVPQCNDMVVQARDFSLHTNEYWNTGYEE